MGAQHTLVADNILMRVKQIGIDMGLGFSAQEGFLTPLDITVSRNKVVDVINCNHIGLHCNTNIAIGLKLDGFAKSEVESTPPETYWHVNSKKSVRLENLSRFISPTTSSHKHCRMCGTIRNGVMAAGSQ